MRYATIKKYDIANGPGVRVSLFVSGCRHRCKGCFNAELRSFDYGMPYTQEIEDEVMEALNKSYIAGLTFLGGEPMEPENQPFVCKLAERVRREMPEKTIWLYTGYNLESDVLAARLGDWDITQRILKCLDVMVDGEFMEALKNPDLRFKGSSNQRVINIPATLERDEIVLWRDEFTTEKDL